MNHAHKIDRRHESVDHVHPTDAGLMDPKGDQVPATGVLGDETLVRTVGPGQHPYPGAPTEPGQESAQAHPGPTRWSTPDAATAGENPNSATMTKDQVLAAIARERDAWEALSAQVGEERMDEPGVAGDWTFKDVVAHLTGWRQRALDRLEAAIDGLPEPPPPWPADLTTDDTINEWIHAENQDRPLGDVLADARASFERLAAAVGAESDTNLFDSRRFAWMDGKSVGQAILDGSFFAHLHEEHAPGIQAWLARREAAGSSR